MIDEPQGPGDDVAAFVAKMRAQGATDDEVHRYLTQHLGMREAPPDEFGDLAKRMRATLPPAPAPKPKLTGVETAAGHLNSLAAGASFGLSPYVQGAAHAVLHREPLGKSIDEQKDLLKRFRGEHPVASTVEEITGALSSPVQVLRAVKAPGFLKAAAEGVVQGGVTGALNADSGDELEGLKHGATTGGIVGGTAHALVPAAVGTGRWIKGVVAPPRGEAGALDAAATAMERAGKTIPDLERAQKTRTSEGGNPQLHELMGDANNPAELRLRKSVENPKSRSGEIAAKAFGNRDAEVGNRIETALRDNSNLRPEPAGFLRDEASAYLTDKTTPMFGKAKAEAHALEAEPPTPPPVKVPAVTETANAPRLSLRDAIEEFKSRSANAATRKEGTVAQQMAREALERQHTETAVPTRGMPSPGRGASPAEIITPPATGRVMADAASESADIAGNHEWYETYRRALPDKLRAQDRTSYDVMRAIESQVNRDIGTYTPSQKAGPDFQKLMELHGLLKEATAAKAPSLPAAKDAFRAGKVSQSAFNLGNNFHKMEPYDIQKVLETGHLPDGNKMSPDDVQQFQQGVVQRVRDLMERKAGNARLQGAAPGKGGAQLGALNADRLDAQLTSALGKKYFDLIPTIKHLLQEENAGRRVLFKAGRFLEPDKAATLGQVVSDVHHGIGFGPKSLIRRTGLGLVAEPIRGWLDKRNAATDEAVARMFTSEGGSLAKVIADMNDALAKRGKGTPDWLRMLQEAAPRAAGSQAGRP